jgi:hypothetical protein
MQTRFRLIRRNIRGGRFYLFDTLTKKRESLKTRSHKEAKALLQTKNEAHQSPALNLQKARIYLLESDPAFAKRTWQHIMDEVTTTKHGETRQR